MTVHVSVHAATDIGPDEAFRRIADYGRYAELTSTVRSVRLEQRAGEPYSVWEVDFRGGILRWTERDEVDVVARVLAFEQVDGDLERFEGRWDVAPDGSGSRVQFTAVLDMGMPSLAPIVDPVAKAALAENIGRILAGLFAGDRLDLAPNRATVGGVLAWSSS